MAKKSCLFFFFLNVGHTNFLTKFTVGFSFKKRWNIKCKDWFEWFPLGLLNGCVTVSYLYSLFFIATDIQKHTITKTVLCTIKACALSDFQQQILTLGDLLMINGQNWSSLCGERCTTPLPRYISGSCVNHQPAIKICGCDSNLREAPLLPFWINHSTVSQGDTGESI